MLAAVHSMPWVAVRPGQSIADRLSGLAPSAEVRTFALADLPGARSPLYVGWALLLSLLVVAWLRPEWRRSVRVGTAVLSLALTFLTFLPGGAAVRASGFREADGPSTDFLAGTWLALVGMLLVASGVSTLAASPKPSTPPEPTPVRPTPAAVTVAADSTAPADPTPIFVPPPGWAARPRPAAVPWWRRPWLVTGVVAACVAGAVLVGALVWHVAAHPPATRRGELAALVVARPADSAPARPAAVDDRVNVPQLLPPGGPDALILAAQLLDVRHAAGAAWTRPDTASVTVTLLQFDSREQADQFQQSYAEFERRARGRGGEVGIPDVPGATAFTGEGQGQAEVDAVAHRDDIVVLISADGGPPDTIAVVESLVREQYNRL
ncbi:hypothetical protein GA0070214_103434 [Micromonospora chaiyaphumensis]|uniref:DUF7373 domain-containing protein n=2 Tax=Micromonospora chaiyaphumensis TaxID=307119 RepID=A0A1C4WCN6_9ACTN|nr:hypothetical protein GA0070214_103434 [Micromonospora chaiyaphumensis]